jgi:D-glycero-D-manno-heptose 1,7-bisphosphate phosphatase
MGVGGVSGGRAVFLDRDGVLNRNVLNPVTNTYESPHRAEDFELLPGVLEGLALLQETGYRLILVSNQPSYAKGKTSLAAIQAIHQCLADTLNGAGISFDAFYYCLHHPEASFPNIRVGANAANRHRISCCKQGRGSTSTSPTHG